ncbi:putative clathrin assembly protein At4g40080 [Punica granatum]|uniref:ENTH domain-containing protein n=2 Tax=Punica granatum TaxID=22663 RepID=A0A218X5H8_PUNGR|nr:putative clathrin assembly protein At4g40080 [Punica granatum]OWM79989.1 hypothetical protein CDL15_Pgr006293 [Punica granatum]PKI47339.1 hypothetical protein CRG98_032264 [Punica granatum]
MEQNNITLRSLSGILKDKASLAKASLFSKTRSYVHKKIIRATTHDPASAPKEYRRTALLSLGLGSSYTARTCIKALMDRLHKTRNASVALKCLFAIHNILSQGSVTLRDELSVFPSHGGHNFLNLSGFRGGFNRETSKYSCWVRWYAEFLEQTLITARVLGYFLTPASLSSTSQVLRKEREVKVRAYSSSDLSQEIDLLVSLVGVICSCPDSIHLQRNDLVYEIVSLVLEDYRVIRYEIRSRLSELEKRSLESLGISELAQVLSASNQFEGCKEKLFALFVNRANYDGLWELITRMKPTLVHHITRTSKVQRMICWTPSDFRFPWHTNGNGFVRDYSAYAVTTT